MTDIKEIVAKNIIELRKKHGLTQTQLAEKINYSDNAVSRWERAEVTPSIETLQDIANVFNVDIEVLVKENANKVAKVYDKKVKINNLAIMLILMSVVWLIAIVCYVVCETAFKINLWVLFIWAVPATCLVMYPYNRYFGRHIFKFVTLSVFVWSFLAALYFQLLQFNVWLIFIIGAPIEVALVIWAFVKPKNFKNKNK